jgi:hypothetical protein
MEDNQPEIEKKICNACGEALNENARICSICGTPVWRLSGYFHKHKSLYATLASILTIMSIIVLIINLGVAQRNLELQKTNFIESYQPKIDVQIMKYEQRGDSIWLTADIVNSGQADALEIKCNTWLLLNGVDSSSSALFRANRLTNKIPLSCPNNYPGIISKDFILCFDISYFWSGDPGVKHLDKYYGFVFKPLKKDYRIRLESKDNFRNFRNPD